MTMHGQNHIKHGTCCYILYVLVRWQHNANVGADINHNHTYIMFIPLSVRLTSWTRQWHRTLDVAPNIFNADIFWKRRVGYEPTNSPWDDSNRQHHNWSPSQHSWASTQSLTHKWLVSGQTCHDSRSAQDSSRRNRLYSHILILASVILLYAWGDRGTLTWRMFIHYWKCITLYPVTHFMSAHSHTKIGNILLCCHASLNDGDTFWEMRRQVISSLYKRHKAYLHNPI